MVREVLWEIGVRARGCSRGCSGNPGVLQAVLLSVLKKLGGVNRKSTLRSTPWSTPGFPEHSREPPDFPEHSREHFPELPGISQLAPLCEARAIATLEILEPLDSQDLLCVRVLLCCCRDPPSRMADSAASSFDFLKHTPEQQEVTAQGAESRAP